jgi:iron complex outermembrane receptor protein
MQLRSPILVTRNKLRPLWLSRVTDRGNAVKHQRQSRKELQKPLLVSLIYLLFLTCAAQATAVPKAPHQEAEEAIAFNIPRQRADAALTALGQQADLTVIYQYDLVKQYITNQLQGDYSLSNAVAILLKDTSLNAAFDSAGHLIIKDSNQSKGKRMNTYSNTKRRKSLLAGLIGVFAATGGMTAVAQDAEGVTNQRQLDEVVVTATKREQSLQGTAISITAVGANEIQQRGLVSREDYLRSIPGVNLTDNGPGQENIVIRGAFGETFSTGATVSSYLADIPLTGYAFGGSADIKLVDIERVEVLRGPQGTLFGSSSLSGAIRYIPAKPDLNDLEGKIKTGYSVTGKNGGGNSLVEGTINIPIIEDKFAIRIVGYRHNNSGYIKNVAGEDPALQASAALFGAEELAVNDNNIGDSSYTGGRLSALWQPSEELTVSFMYLNQDVSQDDRAFERTGQFDDLGAYTRSTYKFGDTIGNGDALRTDLELKNLTVEYDFGWATLLSSTAWIDQSYTRKWELSSFFGGADNAPVTQTSQTEAEVFVEEVRLTSELDGPIQYVFGLYYEDMDMPTNQSTFFGGDPALNPFPAIKLWDLHSDRFTSQKAIFGEISYQFSDTLKATFGGRMFEYETRFAAGVSNAVAIASNSESDKTFKEDGDTFKVAVEYSENEDSLIYASLSNGFRLGRPLNTALISGLCDADSDGFLDGTNVRSDLEGVSSDTLESYELGAKLTFLDGRAKLNTSVYQNNWTNIPVAFFPPGCPTQTIINGGEAQATGAEIEGILALSDALRVNVAVGYVDSKLTADTSAGSDGDRMNFTPEVNGSLGFEYDFMLSGFDAFIRGDYLYFGEYYTKPGEGGKKLDAYGLVNLNAGLNVGAIDVSLSVKNLTNADEFTSLVGIAPPDFALRLRPRTIGITVGYQF